tara:strand:+ start:6437 stop:6727 length:291 start_codon:yes stop_codon:yes gene_type:complete
MITPLKSLKAFDQAEYQGPVVDCKAVPFKIMLEDLLSRLSNGATLAQSAALSSFVQCAGDLKYPELQAVSPICSRLDTIVTSDRFSFWTIPYLHDR